MNLISREEAAAALEKIRQKLCAYSPRAKFCDCKYGAKMDGGEETGCPELRSAIYYLLEKKP